MPRIVTQRAVATKNPRVELFQIGRLKCICTRRLIIRNIQARLSYVPFKGTGYIWQSFHYSLVKQLEWLLVCFPIHHALSKKESTLRRGAFFFFKSRCLPSVLGQTDLRKQYRPRMSDLGLHLFSTWYLAVLDTKRYSDGLDNLMGYFTFHLTEICLFLFTILCYYICYFTFHFKANSLLLFTT